MRVFEAPDRYDVNRLAPKPGDYTFTFASRGIVEGRAVYTFRSDIQKLAAFAVTRIDVDAEHYLPRTLYFHSVNGATKGTGRVSYAPQSRYWLPREASVEARTASGKNARERITWSKFGFPEASARDGYALARFTRRPRATKPSMSPGRSRLRFCVGNDSYRSHAPRVLWRETAGKLSRTMGMRPS